MQSREEKLVVRIASPLKTYFEGEAFSVSAVNESGPFDVLPGHANFFATLTRGILTVDQWGEKTSLSVQHGIIRVLNNRVDVFLDI